MRYCKHCLADGAFCDCKRNTLLKDKFASKFKQIFNKNYLSYDTLSKSALKTRFCPSDTKNDITLSGVFFLPIVGFCLRRVVGDAITGLRFSEVDRAYRDRDEVFERRLNNIQNSRQPETVFYFFVFHK